MYLTVISITVFHCYKIKDVRKIEEKKRKKKTTKFGQILSQSIGLRKEKKIPEGVLTLNIPTGRGLTGPSSQGPPAQPNSL